MIYQTCLFKYCFFFVVVVVVARLQRLQMMLHYKKCWTVMNCPVNLIGPSLFSGLDYWTGLLDSRRLTLAGNVQENTEIPQCHTGKTWLFSIAPWSSPRVQCSTLSSIMMQVLNCFCSLQTVKQSEIGTGNPGNEVSKT